MTARATTKRRKPRALRLAPKSDRAVAVLAHAMAFDALEWHQQDEWKRKAARLMRVVLEVTP